MGPWRRALATSALAILPFLEGCSSVELTPAAIERAQGDGDIPRYSAGVWRDAIVLANDFLASDWRRTLPPGRYELDEQSGMRFVTERGEWPMAIRCTTWGGVCVLFGFAAQEREDGFVVGEMPPERDRLTDNTLFVSGSGWRKPPCDVARLILHETTHVVWREGTIGFWNGVAYYLEAIFLFRYSNHSDERKANGTEDEFDSWFQHRDFLERGEPDLAASVCDWHEHHLQHHDDTCDHGPFDVEPPEPPLPASAR